MSFVLALPLVAGVAQTAHAQVKHDTLKNIKEDTSQIKLQPGLQYMKIFRRNPFRRSPYNYLSPESNLFNVPASTHYYRPPFTGQKSLNEAVIALHNEFSNPILNSRAFRIAALILSFINIPSLITNGFVFYKNQPPPVISIDNPYLYPQTLKGQAKLNFIESRDSWQPLNRNDR